MHDEFIYEHRRVEVQAGIKGEKALRVRISAYVRIYCSHTKENVECAH